MLDLLIVLLLIFLLTIALFIAANANLLVVTLLMSIFSLMTATLFATLNAPDVAFTETAVGAGISTMLFLAVIATTQQLQTYRKKQHWPALVLALMVGAFLIYSTMDLPHYAAATTPANLHLAQYFLTHTATEIGIPNVVTAILASYRGFDTLGELAVIFTAGVGVIGTFSAYSRKHTHGDH